MRAQMNQAFIFIFMLVLIAGITLTAVLLFGRASKAACEAEKATFLTNMEKYANSYSDFGKIEIKEINVPCSYEQVCFLSTAKNSVELGQIDVPFVVNEYVKIDGQDRDNNIFLIKDGEAELLGLIPEINTETDNAICFQRKAGFFEIKFSGAGKTVILGKPVGEP